MIDVSDIEKRIERAIAAPTPIDMKLGGVALENLGQAMEFAKLMAVSGFAVPKWLRGNPGGCLAIVSRALRWGMDPFAVAEKSYMAIGKGGAEHIGYESQLVHAVVTAHAPLKGRLRSEIVGAGEERRCHVWGTFKGETKPHEYTSETLGKKIADIGWNDKQPPQLKGSPLWITEPEVQLTYSAVRQWCRLHSSETLLGVYTPDELTEPVDITPKPLDGLAQRLRDAKKARVQGDRGFDAASVERVGASIIAGEAQEATDDNTKRDSSEAGSDQRTVGAADKRDDNDPHRSGGTLRSDKASRQAATKARPTRAQEQSEENPSLPFGSEGKAKPQKKGRR